ncbi:MAG: C40 family peptidase [Myxococcota bacterium]|nr:NlpC/P60 family protein [Myxococcota bacterium]
MTPITALILAAAFSASRTDVTSEEGRKLTLLDYVQSRSDLPDADKQVWDTALRQVFGGKAIKDGSDEGVTVAKSVVAASIFFGIEPVKAARAAYDAYHDTYRWVPPPIAINYQLMKLQGRAPKAQPRELAYNFPRHFDPEIAPEIVFWWEEMLGRGAIAKADIARITASLEKTRELMRPLLLERLWQGVELEAREQTSAVREELTTLGRELARGYANVGRLRQGTYYERYLALATELGQKARARPEPQQPRRVEAPPKQPPRDAQHAPKREKAPPPIAGDELVVAEPGFAGSLRKAAGGWLGTPYLFGGTDRRGIDCSAFSRAIYDETTAIDLPRNSRAQFSLGAGVDKARLAPGDLVFFDTFDRGTVTHVGVYVGSGEFAHASSSRGVVIDTLGSAYYERAWWGGKRLLSQ